MYDMFWHIQMMRRFLFFNLLIFKVNWQDISMLSSKKSKVKKKGGDSVSAVSDSAEIQG